MLPLFYIQGLANQIIGNAARYLTMFEGITTEMLSKMDGHPFAKADVLDELQQQRKHQMSKQQSPDAKANDFPLALLRRHETRLLPPANKPVGPLRGLRAPDIGSLVKVRGIVTRTSDVKPLLEVITYTCETCGREIYHDVSNRKDYLPLLNCTNEQCGATGMGGRLFAQTRGSKFISFFCTNSDLISINVILNRHFFCGYFQILKHLKKIGPSKNI